MRPREETVEVTTVILNTGTVAQLPYHLQVIIHPLLEPFCFQALAFSAHPFQMQHQVILNVMNGLMDAFLRRHKNIGRINQQLLKNFQANVVYRIKRDRKSTRLNSSHVRISYAVFCLKKKKKKNKK